MRIPSTILPRATTQPVNSTISVDFVHPSLEIQDLYLLPLTVSNPNVSFRTMISNRLTTSWFPLAEACNNTGPDDTKPWNKYLENCYEGQLLDPSKSKTMTQTPNGAFTVPSTDTDLWGEAYWGEGSTGTDTVTIAGVDIPDIELNFATGINASHAHLGLAKGSTLLDKLVEQKIINARAFSLFVGSDVRYLQNWDPNAKDANYPGSIVFGGLDFAKQSETFIRGDLDTDGIPQLEVLGINVHAQHAVYDIMGGLGVDTYDAEIDVSSPWIYVPEVAAQAIRAKRDNNWDNSGDIVSTPVHMGNISMTVQVKGAGHGGGASEVNITFPESIWGWDRSYYSQPSVTKNKYFPFLINKSTARARVILGRPFLKAVYLAINYDSNEFQVAPASYSSNSQIRPFKAVAADGSNRLESFPSLTDIILESPGANQTATALPDPSGTALADSSSGTPTGAIAGGVVGGVLGLLAIAGLIFLFMRRGKKKPPSPNNREDVLPTPPTAGAMGAPSQEQPLEYFKAELPATAERTEDYYAPLGELAATSPTEVKQAHYHEPEMDPQEVPASPVVPEAFVHVPKPPQAGVPGQNVHELP
ncbi:aspartic peptidase domain-containing protein [Morchella snyderi]|nr:aspartic peptidase domain-containing protein [Morchella snyderi]